jgi:DNA repair exonuclease SbcCD ATPase subunit
MNPPGEKPWTTPTSKYNQKLSDQGSPGPAPSATESRSGDSVRSPREGMFVDARITILKQQLREAQFSLQEKQRNLDKVLHDLYVVTHMPSTKDTRLQEAENAQKILETTIEGLLTEKQGLLDQIQGLAKNEATLAAERTQSIQQLEAVYRQKLATAARSTVAQQQKYEAKIQDLEETNRQLQYQFQTLDVDSEQARLESKAEIEDLNVRIQELEDRGQRQVSDSDRLRDMLHEVQTAMREAEVKIAEMETESEVQTNTLESIMDYNKDLCEKLESLRPKAEAPNQVAETQLAQETSPKSESPSRR